MSSIDSALNSSSTLVVLDFIKPKKPDLSETDTAKYGRIATLIFMTIAAVVAPLIAYAGGLFKYIQEAFSYIVPPVVAIFIVGLFWARGNGKGALRTLIVGHSISAIIFLVTKLGYITIHYTIVAGLNTIFCAFLFYLGAPADWCQYGYGAALVQRLPGALCRPAYFDCLAGHRFLVTAFFYDTCV